MRLRTSSGRSVDTLRPKERAALASIGKSWVQRPLAEGGSHLLGLGAGEPPAQQLGDEVAHLSLCLARDVGQDQGLVIHLVGVLLGHGGEDRCGRVFAELWVDRAEHGAEGDRTIRAPGKSPFNSTSCRDRNAANAPSGYRPGQLVLEPVERRQLADHRPGVRPAGDRTRPLLLVCV
jgi:hypothetical protein